MTYVQRLPNLQFPTIELSGRTIAFLLVASLHVFVIGLIIEELRTTHFPLPATPHAIVLLPETREPVVESDPLDNVAPTFERQRIVAQQPVIDTEQSPRTPDRRLQPQWTDARVAAPAEREVDVRSYPRQDPDNPIGRPLYPPQSVRLEESGVVLLNVCVDTTGRPTGINLRASSGYKRLDQAAIKHLRKPSIRLLPGTEDGVPVPMCADLRMRFNFDTP